MSDQTPAIPAVDVLKLLQSGSIHELETTVLEMLGVQPLTPRTLGALIDEQAHEDTQVRDAIEGGITFKTNKGAGDVNLFLAGTMVGVNFGESRGKTLNDYRMALSAKVITLLRVYYALTAELKRVNRLTGEITGMGNRAPLDLLADALTDGVDLTECNCGNGCDGSCTHAMLITCLRMLGVQ